MLKDFWKHASEQEQEVKQEVLILKDEYMKPEPCKSQDLENDTSMNFQWAKFPSSPSTWRKDYGSSQPFFFFLTWQIVLIYCSHTNIFPVYNTSNQIMFPGAMSLFHSEVYQNKASQIFFCVFLSSESEGEGTLGGVSIT